MDVAYESAIIGEIDVVNTETQARFRQRRGKFLEWTGDANCNADTEQSPFNRRPIEKIRRLAVADDDFTVCVLT